MSFGRRLALFFVLIVLVPMLALVGVVVIVSEDSRDGKADARLAAGLETALALYSQRVSDAGPAAKEIAADPRLGSGLRSGDRAELERFAADAARDPGVVAVEVLGPAGTPEAGAGSEDAIAFAKLDLADGGAQRGALLVSVTNGPDFAAELNRLTGRDLVVTRADAVVGATVEPPGINLDPGETGDVTMGGEDYRAHVLDLDESDGEALLMLGPRPEGGVLSLGRPVIALLVAFLLLAAVLAYGLARALTGLHSRVAAQALIDPLTGLFNRRRMDELLAREVERSLRFGHELSVLIVDVDDFKRINDEHGHLVGDEVLMRISDAVRQTARTIDLAARYGGDELALMLIETDAAGAEIVAERLCRNVRDQRIEGMKGGRSGVTISIGVATLPACAGDTASLVDAADQALLVAKRGGKDQISSAPRRSRPETNGETNGTPGAAELKPAGRGERRWRARG